MFPGIDLLQAAAGSKRDYYPANYAPRHSGPLPVEVQFTKLF
jgi:hypothetical protein